MGKIRGGKKSRGRAKVTTSWPQFGNGRMLPTEIQRPIPPLTLQEKVTWSWRLEPKLPKEEADFRLARTGEKGVSGGVARVGALPLIKPTASGAISLGSVPTASEAVSVWKSRWPLIAGRYFHGDCYWTPGRQKRCPQPQGPQRDLSIRTSGATGRGPGSSPLEKRVVIKAQESPLRKGPGAPRA